MKKVTVLLTAALFLGACHCTCKNSKCAAPKAKPAAAAPVKKAQPAPKTHVVQEQDFAGVAKVTKTSAEKAVITFNKPIEFDYNSDTLTQDSQKSVRQLGRILKKYPHSKMVVAGYTDSMGDINYNIDLSQRRAQAVADQLVKEGVNPEQLTAVGHGSRNPIATNKTAEGRAQNRRVEVEISNN